jgi:hypothetical protein
VNQGKDAVSSILKALKKVETAGPEAAGPRPSLRLAPEPPPSLWRRRPFLLSALAGGLLLAAVAAYYLAARFETSAPESAVGAGRTVQARLPAAPAPPSAPPPAPAPASAPPIAVAAPAEPPVEATPPVQAPPPTTRLRPRDTVPGAPAATDSRPAPAPRGPSGQERPAPVRPAPAPTRSAEDNLSRLDDSKLKVMAIAWAEDPGRRIAVVNGHIVREGESVDGYTVTRIRRDDLVVSDGSRSWRAELNLRSQP